MKFALRLCLVLWMTLATLHVGLAAQHPLDGKADVVLKTWDRSGELIGQCVAVLIDTDKVAVPSLYLYGAADIRLTHGTSALEPKAFYELQGQYVSILCFDPPVSPDIVPPVATAELGSWLRYCDGIPNAGEGGKARLLYLHRQAVVSNYAVTFDSAVAPGATYYDSDGGLVGILSVSPSVDPLHPDVLTLCPARDLVAYMHWIDDHERGESESLKTLPGSHNVRAADLSRYFLQREATADALSRLTARWGAEDPDWWKGLPQELFFILLTVAMKYELAELQASLIQDPPELAGSGADRLRLAKAAMLAQRGALSEAEAELEPLIEAGSPVKPVACIIMAQIMSQSGRTREVMRYLRESAAEFHVDPFAWELAARVYADRDAVPDYIAVSEMRQRLDWSVSASLSPAVQLIKWEQYEKASEFARTGVERWPENANCLDALVWALVGMGNMESAREHLHELERIDPGRASKLVESVPALRDP